MVAIRVILVMVVAILVGAVLFPVAGAVSTKCVVIVSVSASVSLIAITIFVVVAVVVATCKHNCRCSDLHSNVYLRLCFSRRRQGESEHQTKCCE